MTTKEFLHNVGFWAVTHISALQAVANGTGGGLKSHQWAFSRKMWIALWANNITLLWTFQTESHAFPMYCLALSTKLQMRTSKQHQSNVVCKLLDVMTNHLVWMCFFLQAQVEKSEKYLVLQRNAFECVYFCVHVRAFVFMCVCVCACGCACMFLMCTHFPPRRALNPCWTQTDCV